MLTAQRFSSTEACGRLGIRGKRIQRLYGEALRHHSVEALEGVIRTLALFDRRVRELKASLHPGLLALLVYHAVFKRGGVPRSSGGPSGVAQG